VTTTKRVGIIGGVRIPFCRNNTAYADIGNFGMSVKVLGTLVERFGLHGLELGEVAFGAVIRHAFDWNLAREATLSSGLAPTTPGITCTRACGSSLDNAIIVGNKIAMGQIDSGIAVASRTVKAPELVEAAARTAAIIGIRGIANIQFKRAADGVFKLLEVNPRFPGTLPLTGAAGVDMPKLMAAELAGEKLPDGPLPYQELMVVRYWTEQYLDPGEWAKLCRQP